ncbi:unnamed protein product [Prorocentrum cordatum]|uniref:Uncharacterized protein n=1 Tax=Prorocentrum cordatum TaxID=2364126 RepID=A0ABN9RH81_9DINO|nr:unnamed protein product [Polarella glacialis]
MEMQLVTQMTNELKDHGIDVKWQALMLASGRRIKNMLATTTEVLNCLQERYDARDARVAVVFTECKFHSAIVFGHEDDQPDRVYILGLSGRSRVLARAPLAELLRHDWSGVEFLCPPGDTWLPYSDSGDIPELHPLWESEAPEASLVYDESSGAFLAPEADPATKERSRSASPWRRQGLTPP